jgi:hypothetical protein
MNDRAPGVTIPFGMLVLRDRAYDTDKPNSDHRRVHAKTDIKVWTQNEPATLCVTSSFRMTHETRFELATHYCPRFARL